jgi:hypothetical protein
LSGTQLSFHGAGTCVVNISQAGDATHAGATTQLRINVGAMATTLALSTSPTNLRYGQSHRATARVAFTAGAANGKVQFLLDGRKIGKPVSVSKGAAVSPSLVSATQRALWPGTHVVTALFTPADSVNHSSAKAVARYVVKKASVKLGLVVRPTVVTATLTPAGAKTDGVVVFRWAGKVIGRVLAHQGVATLYYALAPNQLSRVSATYQGNLFTLAATDTRATYQA